MLRILVSAALCSALALVGLAGTASAANKKAYALGGNARYQIGGGLPLPITGQPPPNGRIFPVAGARVFQTLGADPKRMSIEGGQMTEAVVPRVAVGVFLNNSALFEVESNLGFTFPAPAQPNGDRSVVFQAGGRTGAAVTTVVPGGSISGSFQYTATGAQFGGPGQGRVIGTAAVWGLVATAPPCTGCLAAKIVANPAPFNAAGGPFGFLSSTAPLPPVPGVFVVNATAGGLITTRTPTPSNNPGGINGATSAGAPWTTGQVVVSQPAAFGGIELFTLNGSDARVNGIGNISLVSAALSNRSLSGPNANRGWLNLTLTDTGGPVPTTSSWGLATLMVLIAGTTIWMTRRSFATDAA